ncbi:PDZ domain-containing protein [Aureisphaera sp.]
MRSSISIVLLLVLFGLCTSCSTSLWGVKGSHDTVTVNIKKSSKEKFTLRTKDGLLVDSAIPTAAGVLTFKLPTDVAPQTRLFKVEDPKGKPVAFKSTGITTFRNPTWEQYLSSRENYITSSKLVKKYEFLNEEMFGYMQRARRSLRSNDAYGSGTCTRPRRGSLPRLPSTACTRSEAHKVGTAVCLASTGSAEACSMVASQIGSSLDFNVRSFISSPACGYMVSKYLNQPYTLENFLGDVALGFGEDLAKKGIQSGNLFDILAGLIIGGVVLDQKVKRFNSCVSTVSQQCRAEYQNWEYRSQQIINRPGEVMAECERSLNNLQLTEPVYDAGVVQLTKYRKEFADRKNTLNRVAGKGPSVIMGAIIAPKPTTTSTAEPQTRGLIGFRGENLKSFQHEGKTYAYGVRITDIIDRGLPAYKAGLRKGDIIVGLDGYKAKDMEYVSGHVNKNSGKAIRVTYKRGATISDATVIPERVRFVMGVTVQQDEYGAKVTKVNPGQPAADGGMRVGDIVLMADAAPVDTLLDLQNYLTETAGRQVRLAVKRGNSVKIVFVTPKVMRL